MLLLEAARSAFLVGLSILPVRDDGSKAPDVSSWREFQSVRPTIETMRAFDFAQCSGIGMVAGVGSAHRESWDFDDAGAYQAFVEMAASCGLGDLVKCIRQGYEDETPGGGRRWMWVIPTRSTGGTAPWHAGPAETVIPRSRH